MHRGHHHHRHGHFRGRHGIPSREQSVERLRSYREHLEGELAKVDELLGRLADAPAAPATPSE
ncbi:MAG TPA: hypothetical protein VFA97_11485 [Gaiellaceae bacterium]|nr:hypothetical protein [Gaiellaceae bacterium]